MALTVSALREKWKGREQWKSDGGARGGGRLVARLGKTGATFYFSYFDAANARRFLHIGTHDSDGTRGVTLQQARDRAAELSKLYRSGVKNLHDHFEQEQRAQEKARNEAIAAAQRAEERARSATLRELCEAYADHLERSGKESARAVRNSFALHVSSTATAAKRAADVSVDELVELLATLVQAGKGRTAGKLRSYLLRAYALAASARTDPTVPLTLRAFGVMVNPVASIPALSAFNRARERHLSAEELGAFIKRAEAQPADGLRDAVLLALRLGGQRPAQLLRVTPADVDLNEATVTLYDSKGARKQARAHVLPLTKKTCAILTRLLEHEPASLFMVGTRTVTPEALSAYVTQISAAMVEAKEAREAFQLRDIRRTCETMLAALGVSSDVRAQLLSHGLGGVQARHYDRHSYALEKRAALEKWERHLDRLASGKPATVVRARFGERRAKGI